MRPEVDDISTGGQKYYRRWMTARFWPQGYAPTKHRVKLTVKTDVTDDHGIPAGIAERSEPAAGRPGPFDQRTWAL